MVKSMKNKTGLYIGRFQPFHNGHMYMVREALKNCDHLIIAIGSAQEARTEKNPFTNMERSLAIACSIPLVDADRVTIVSINDRKNKADNSSWGEYLLKEVEELSGMRPDICFTGEEQVRQHWFDTVEIEEVVIKRDIIPISATQVREVIKNNDQELFNSLVPKGTQAMWNLMREVLKDEREDT